MTQNPSNETEHALARRTILKAAGLGMGAGMLSGLAATAAQAQGAAVAAPAAAGADVWSTEYWTKKGEINLNIYRKRVGAPVAGEKPRPVLFWCTARRIPRAPPMICRFPAPRPNTP